MTTESIEQKGKRLRVELYLFKRKLAKQIRALPANPKTTPLNANGSCFIIMNGDLGSNWSAEYHQFQRQYDELAKLLLGTKGRVLSTVEKALTAGKVRVDSYTLYLHPGVIKNVKGLLCKQMT